MEERFHVQKNDVIGEHRLDGSTPHPLPYVSKAIGNITDDMLGNVYSNDRAVDAHVQVDKLMSGLRRSSGRYTTTLVAQVQVVTSKRGKGFSLKGGGG